MKTLTFIVSGDAKSSDNTVRTQDVGVTLLRHAADLVHLVATKEPYVVTLSAFGVTCTAKMVDEPANEEKGTISYATGVPRAVPCAAPSPSPSEP
jgi:hypothetical protein